MTTRRIRGAPAVLGTLMLVALTCAAPVARAAATDRPDDGGDEGWYKVLRYARCALLIFVAGTPASVSAAFFDCTRLYLEEPPAGGGGR